MKFTLSLILSFYYLMPLKAQKGGNQNYFMVSGKITQTADFCGGARPSDEMMEQIQKPQIYSGKTLYVRKGKGNDLKRPVIMKFMADSAGKFTLMLKPGVYSIIQTEQLKPLNMKKIFSAPNVVADKACLKQWWSKAYFVLEIKDKNIEGLEFNFHHKCFIEGDVPCLNYTGPLPP